MCLYSHDCVSLTDSPRHPRVQSLERDWLLPEHVLQSDQPVQVHLTPVKHEQNKLLLLFHHRFCSISLVNEN